MSGSSYVMSCLQCEISVIQDPADKDPLLKNVKRSLGLPAYAVATEESRLLILPEGWLQGFVPNRSVADWLKVCIRISRDRKRMRWEISAAGITRISRAPSSEKRRLAGSIFRYGFHRRAVRQSRAQISPAQPGDPQRVVASDQPSGRAE